MEAQFRKRLLQERFFRIRDITWNFNISAVTLNQILTKGWSRTGYQRSREF